MSKHEIPSSMLPQLFIVVIQFDVLVVGKISLYFWLLKMYGMEEPFERRPKPKEENIATPKSEKAPSFPRSNFASEAFPYP